MTRRAALVVGAAALVAVGIEGGVARADEKTCVIDQVFGMAAPEPWQLLLLAPFPAVVWGADEVYRAWSRQRAGRSRDLRR